MNYLTQLSPGECQNFVALIFLKTEKAFLKNILIFLEKTCSKFCHPAQPIRISLIEIVMLIALLVGFTEIIVVTSFHEYITNDSYPLIIVVLGH